MLLRIESIDVAKMKFRPQTFSRKFRVFNFYLVSGDLFLVCFIGLPSSLLGGWPQDGEGERCVQVERR